MKEESYDRDVTRHASARAGRRMGMGAGRKMRTGNSGVEERVVEGGEWAPVGGREIVEDSWQGSI